MDEKGKVTLAPVDMEAKDQVMLKELMTIRRHVNGIRQMMVFVVAVIAFLLIFFVCSALWLFIMAPIPLY